MILKKEEAIQTMNQLGSEKKPFFFFTDFLGSRAWVSQEPSPASVRFSFSGKEINPHPSDHTIQKSPLSYQEYASVHEAVKAEINFGNSFLVNLTFKTPVETGLSLAEIYDKSFAKYKVLFDNHFTCFSPETFIKIKDKKILSYPMKGTIDASIDNARVKILNDPKEQAEHITIVDLIRNDLSRIAKNVQVTDFRFISEVKNTEKTLLQVSSEIQGELNYDYLERMGDIVFELLPAGSISGAPKPKTVEIIQELELQSRGYFTGICGYFDGAELDSGVMIRFIEQTDEGIFYRSGGGITSFSQARKEYQEMIDKIYLPI